MKEFVVAQVKRSQIHPSYIEFAGGLFNGVKHVVDQMSRSRNDNTALDGRISREVSLH